MDTACNTDRYLKQVFEIIAAHMKEHPARIYLFGSRAAGTARVFSDCDIAIEPVRDLPLGHLSRLKEKLEESHVPYVVEVIDLSQTSEEFARKVRDEGILWINTSNA
ncbi:nucleotidyltransferase family protein [Desulfonatronum parangueonense]